VSLVEKRNRKRIEYKIMEVISENLNLKDLKKNKKVLGIKCVTARNEENRRFKNRYEFDKYQFDS
jgi:hypothetical protein